MMKKQEVRYVFVNPNTGKDMERVLQNMAIEKVRSARISQPRLCEIQN